MEYTVIQSHKLSKPYDPRYVAVEKDTGKVLDDAQGHGYKSAQKARAAGGYKNQSPAKRREREPKEESVRKRRK